MRCSNRSILLLCCLAIGSADGGTSVLKAQPPAAADEPTAAQESSAAYLVELPASQSIRVPAPALSTGLTAVQRQGVLEELAGRDGWERFARDSLSAPTRVQLEPLRDAADQRIGYLLHSAYVVYADLDQLSDQRLMESLFGEADQQEGLVMQELNPADLDALTASERQDPNRKFFWLELPLLNKVLVRGVVQLQKSKTPEGFVLRWQIDPRFAMPPTHTAPDTPATHQNSWAQLTFNELGGIEVGELRPYQGLGGQISLFQIDPAHSQLLLESWLVLHEPPDWFEGENYLRAKLPASVQESAKRFRRKLRDLQQ